MHAAQGGLCAICRERPAEHVDHCHLTGLVRSLLCFNCNQGLGNFRDNWEFLIAAADYMRKAQSTAPEEVDLSEFLSEDGTTYVIVGAELPGAGAAR